MSYIVLYYSGGRAETLITNLIGLERHNGSAIQSDKTLSVIKRQKGLKRRLSNWKLEFCQVRSGLQLINQLKE